MPKLPRYLYRITYVKYPIDRGGYLISHNADALARASLEDVNKLDPRNLPLVHPKEWEVIARMFAWHRFRERGQNFTLLKIRSDKIELIENRPHGVLDYGEYFARVPKHAVVEEREYTWAKDNRPMNIAESAKRNWPRIFALSEGWSPTPLK